MKFSKICKKIQFQSEHALNFHARQACASEKL